MTFDGVLSYKSVITVSKAFFFYWMFSSFTYQMLASFKFYFVCLNVLPTCKLVYCMNASCWTEESDPLSWDHGWL